MSPASASSIGGAGEAAEGEDAGDAEALDLGAVAGEGVDRLAGADRAALDAAGEEAAEEGVGGQRRRQHGEGLVAAGDLRGRRDVVEDELVERVEVLARAVELGVGPAGAAGGVEDREVELVLVGVERHEEVEDLVQRPVGLGVGLVDLVEDDDRAQAEPQRLGGDELGLRHRAFGGVDEEEDAVDHAEDALDLAAEVGVAGGVDDVDAVALPLDRGRLGEDGDAALALEVVGIEGPLDRGLVLAEGAGLLEQGVDQRGLAMVDVRDDRDVADIHRGRSSGSRRP